MKATFTFVKKEITEQIRSGRLLIILALFFLLGVMNPLVAKLTPWLLETLSDSMAESGMTVTLVKISAMDSWVQFFKNMPIALVAFVLLQSAIFTREYSSGTLLLSLTKGLHRFKVIVAKAFVLFAVWSVGYWLCFGITYLYNDIFWDNAVAKSLLPSCLYWWLFGVFTVSLITLFSTLCATNTGVLVGTGSTVLFSYLVGLLPKINRYLPTFLTDGNSLIYGVLGGKAYAVAVVVTVLLTVLCFVVSVPIFNKKQL